MCTLMYAVGTFHIWTDNSACPTGALYIVVNECHYMCLSSGWNLKPTCQFKWIFVAFFAAHFYQLKNKKTEGEEERD